MESTSKSKFPYMLGLLCIIPLVGGFAGIALILYGIFKYKDKLLVAIGVMGLIVTIGVYSFLFYDMKYGEGTTKSFVKLTQQGLNSIITNIEFYKSQNGGYPDSLEQLKKIDKTIIIDDPLLTRKMDENIKTKFYYKKIDSGYTLFSVGIDGIPNTTDDIYPTILVTNKNKLGLRK